MLYLSNIFCSAFGPGPAGLGYLVVVALRVLVVDVAVLAKGTPMLKLEGDLAEV